MKNKIDSQALGVINHHIEHGGSDNFIAVFLYPDGQEAVVSIPVSGEGAMSAESTKEFLHTHVGEAINNLIITLND